MRITIPLKVSFMDRPKAIHAQATRPSLYDPLCCVGSGGVFAVPGFDDVVDDVVQKMVTRGEGQINKATARRDLKVWLRKHQYRPTAPGSASDLSTDNRLDLILETQARMRRGEAQWQQGMSRMAISMYPCWEFTRVEDRKEPRNWPEVWVEHGGQFYPGVGSYEEGRMIARKDSTIWRDINYFGNDYPPFAFNSGMGQRGVARAWCVANHLIREDEFTMREAA